MLRTKLRHLMTQEDIDNLLAQHENVVICCGRMGPMCLPVYAVMAELQAEYPHVQFRDLDFDSPAAAFIKDLPACASFKDLPYTVYFRKGGEVVKATSGIQTREQMTGVLDSVFAS